MSTDVATTRKTTSDAAAAHRRDERTLLLRAQRGDVAAATDLYLPHSAGITRYLEGLVGADDADDLAADTFVRMVHSIHGFRREGTPFGSWLYRVARNLAFDHLRRRRTESRAHAAAPFATTDHPSAEDEAMRGFGRERVAAYVRRLPLEQQRVIALRYRLDRSTPDTALELGKSEGAVKALQNRALSTLRQRLAEAA